MSAEAERLGREISLAMAAGDDGAVAAAVCELEFFALQAGERYAEGQAILFATEIAPVAVALRSAGCSAAPLLESVAAGLRAHLEVLDALTAKLR